MLKDEYCNLHIPVERPQLRGNRCEAIETRLDNIEASLKTQRSRHEEHSIRRDFVGKNLLKKDVHVKHESNN